MAKGYWIARVDITDSEAYPDYLRLGAAAYEKYGARFLVRGGRQQAVEGVARARNVVIEFADYDTALACYRSPEYEAARAVRQASATSELLIVEGV